MKTTKPMTILVGAALALLVGCAATGATSPPATALACSARPVRDSAREMAHDGRPGHPAPSVRNPRASLTREHAGRDQDAAYVVNASDPEIARGNRSADCVLTLARNASP